jgi:hypothetical protein
MLIPISCSVKLWNIGVHAGGVEVLSSRGERLLSGWVWLGLQDGRGKHHHSGGYMGSLEPVPLSPDTLMHPADSDSRSVPLCI